MFLFGSGFVVGVALAASASWFYYSHAIASKVTAGIASVKADVATVQTQIASIKPLP